MTSCIKCGTTLAADEKFCSACGQPLHGAYIEDAYAPGAAPKSPRHYLGVARKWLMAISILTLLSGLGFYFVQKSAIEKDIREAEANTAQLDPVLRDELMVKETGMTFAGAIAHDRGMVKLLLAVNMALSLIYLVLWSWAKHNPYMASLVALMLFVTVVLVSAVLEPKTLAQGIIVKIFFTIALVRAVMAGNEERKLALAT